MSVSRRNLVGVVLAMLLVASGTALAALPPGGSFSDDNGNVHEGNIEAIAAEGITRGCNPPDNDLFCPDQSVTRGQMAAFLKRALGLPNASADYFSDDADSVFQADINALAESGITRGCNPPDNDLFCPDQSVTRGQMAAFLKRALGLPNASADYFSDDADSVFQADINALAESGITRGCNPPDNDLFCPRDEVKRDQMASFLARALGLSPIVPPPPETTTTTSTTSTTVPSNPGDDVDCSDFDTWEEAQEWFDTYYPYYGDVANLDADGDGIACETLPGAP